MADILPVILSIIHYGIAVSSIKRIVLTDTSILVYHVPMSVYKKYRPFIRAISDYGLYAEMSRKHLKIMKDGRMVSSMSITPGDARVAVDHTLRHLIADGYLPKVNRNNYVHELKRASK